MRDARTLDGVRYAPGVKFRVMQPCTLSGLKPDGPSAFRGWGQDLEPGDILTCTGFGPGFGSDPGYGVNFTSEVSRAEHVNSCEIRPSVGGMWGYRPAPGLLEPLEHAINRAATWQVHEDPDLPKGSVEIGGVEVFVYFNHGELVVSLHYDTADPEVQTAAFTVPTRVVAGDGSTVWQES